jgi:hypothetical protein
MWEQYLKKFLGYFLGYGVAFFILGFWLLGLTGPNIYIWILLFFILFIVVTYLTSRDIFGEYQKKHDQEIEKYREENNKERKRRMDAQKETSLWKKSLIEKSAGYPTLLQEIDHYEKIKDEKLEEFLEYKSHPARKSAEIVKEQSRRRRQAEYENKKTQAIIEYYESIAPFLVDLKNDIVEAENEEKYRDYNEKEKLDPTINYLTKEEFRNLSTAKKNQMALDRFWKRPKSKWLIGRLYERFVGYLYEKQDYDVEYVGIFKGFEDLGRDLICQKNNEFVVIQCKNWAKFRTIYEKHIFQFFGTVFQYKDENPNKKVKAIFYTSTELSDLARRFSKELGIELKENFKFDKDYPSIKCNISRVDGTKIYHLPFDQQYDNTKVEKKRGEFYCKSVKEAEDAGFRRAFRYKGKKPEAMK